MTDRTVALAGALTRVRARIDDACRGAGRHPAEVRLLAVTKTFPASDVAALVGLGLASFGESRDQEASAKVGDVARLCPDATVRWEMVGRLQRNKARSVARWADVVHSVNSVTLVDTLGRAARRAIDEQRRNSPLIVLVQVSLDPEPIRGGVPPPDAVRLADHVAATAHRLGGIRLGGVMGLAPLEDDPEEAFATLAEVAERVRSNHPDAVEISAGMSSDLDTAIRYGSTCVRVGTALLGARDLALP